MRLPVLLAALSVTLFTLDLAAQTPAVAAPRPAATTAQARAVRATQPPNIDGRDDDPVWRTVEPTSEFYEFQPAEGKAPRFKTEFKAAYDDRNLYVFVRAYDPHPDSIRKALTRRDVRGQSDQLKVMIDSYHDRRSGFEFAVNPDGVKRDFAMYNDRDEDPSYDAVWDVGTQIDSLGWTAEYRIPLSQLRYTTKNEHTFGFAVWRDIERYKERTSWPAYRPSQSGVSSQLGDLTGIENIAPFRRLEISPFGVAKTESQQRVVSTPGAPPSWHQNQKMTGGVDLKYGLTPNITIDATVNPDFGQVEADPAVLNLSAFEQFFSERRPFFVEGSGLYSFQQNSSPVNRSSENLFYSRRIGRSPQLRGVYGDVASPTVTPILGAAKVTGRLAGGLNVGVVEAVTQKEEGSNGRTIEPLTSYSVVRAQQDFNHGNSHVGLIGTGVDRALDQWTDPFLRRQAFVGGGDFRHRWGKSRYEINGKATFSNVRGSRQAITRTQLNPVHNYQRPDDDLFLDTTRTALSGNAQEFNVSKFGGNIVRWLSGYERQSAGYEINDLGFLRKADRQTWKNWMGLNFNKPTKLYRQAQANFNFQEYWTSTGLRTDQMVNTNESVNLANNQWIFFNTTLGQLPGSYCENCSRGGPAMRASQLWTWSLGWQGDDRRRVVPSIFYGYGRGEDGHSVNKSFDPSASFRLLPQLQMQLSMSVEDNQDDIQWLGNFASGGVTHYAFGHLSQETRTASVRLDYAMTPTLTLQLYGQPFFSRGSFTNVRELSDTPRAESYEARFRPFTPPPGTTSGFDVKQLRSNTVLRWEFRPGSTAYAVWTHGREGGDVFLDRPWRDEYSDLLALHPVNTFLIKVAYWLNR